MKFTKEDFLCKEGFYYVGDVIDVDGNPWVEEEQLELIIEELNAGVTNGPVTFVVPGRKDVIFAPVMPENEFNYIHLN